MTVEITEKTENTFSFINKSDPYKLRVKPEVEKTLSINLMNVSEKDVFTVMAIMSAYVNNSMLEECLFEIG